MVLTEQQFLDGLTADQAAYFNSRLVSIRNEYQASYAQSVVDVSAAKDGLLAAEQEAHSATKTLLDEATAKLPELQAEVDRLTARLPPQPINGVPQLVTRTQARLALYSAGLLPSVEAAVTAGGTESQIWYEAADWHRSSPALLALGSGLGLTSEQIDALFVAAGAITT